MALTTVPVHILILAPVTNTPAVGTVVFNTMIELRDVVDNIVYAPMSFTATLVNGEATITLPTTDNLDLIPTSWVYQVWINTDILNEVQYMQIPFAPGTTEFADIEPVDFDPCTDLLIPAAPFPPNPEDLFVRKTGDTMSGNLLINANLQVNGDAGVLDDLQVGGDANVDGVLTNTFQTTSLNIGQLAVMGLSSAVTFGGDISVNAGDATRIDISATEGFIVTWFTSGQPSPTNPSVVKVTLPAQVGILPAFAPITWYRINALGALVQQGTTPTPQQRRENLILGATATTGLGTNVIVDQTLPVIPYQVNNQLVDLMDGLGGFSMTGNRISPNGVNLNINKTVGTVFARAFSHIPNFQDPHTGTLIAQTPMNFRHITAVPGGAGALVNALNVGFYDPGGAGVVTPVGGGANTATNFRVWGFANNNTNDQILIQYGQTTYATLAAAVAALGTTNFIPSPTATGSGVLLGWISAIRTAVNLSDPTQATFTSLAGKFQNP